MNELKTASWDNSNIYQNLKDPKINFDLDLITANTKTIAEKNSLTDLESVTTLYRLYLDTNIFFYKLMTYSMTANSVDTQDLDAKALTDQVSKKSVEITKAFKPIQMWVVNSSEEFFKQFISDSRVSELKFSLEKERKNADYLLSVNEEVLLAGFSLDGLSAWGKLYNDLSGAMKVNIDGEIMGLASANNLYSNNDRIKREKAYRAINESWRQQEISACAILNSINGWRNENFKVRSTKNELHYLDQTCIAANITRETLQTLMTTTYEKRAVGQEALTLMARELNLDQLGPWDLMAPKPEVKAAEKISYPRAIELIKEAFHEVSPEMADFAQMMMDKKWIDCNDSQNRAQGAYCTGFANVREPRIFMTYDGSMKNVITLAHEIGHAYHSWVMKDIPFMETSYPMTLAETASIFAETTVRDYLLKTSKSKDELKTILWQEIQSAQSLLINIPARYEFEKRFVELRKNKNVSVPETKELMVASQKYWYEQTLSECDEMFWASKLHFSMSGRSFYNYPYLFGYLFSLGIYAKKESLGLDFHKRYVDLLKDTGRMTAEELVQKHFNEDITKKDFWLRSIQIVEKSIKKYKEL
ncbi:MAG: M3 family oligoendopeptidase [Bacteriovoracaceae bacterium]|nr:M3 family oligoendopeptidase [Bacteriovoracaceae bacterium]